jgi:tripartite-type tricarboxylate transporter receptor subunit TctC
MASGSTAMLMDSSRERGSTAFLDFTYSCQASSDALPGVSDFAWAQTYPSRPVYMIVGFLAGGAADVTARLVGQWLSNRLGQPFVTENKPGAAANIAAEAVVPLAIFQS